MATAQKTELTGGSQLERGYKSSRTAVRSLFKGGLWTTSNMPSEMRRKLDALGSHLVQCLDMLDLESTEGLPLDVWKEIRDQLSDAFCGKPHSPEHAALAEVVEQYAIPKQFIFDMVNGADYWIRFRKFSTFEELETFASNIAGSAMATAVPVMGYVKPDWEVPALACGKAIFLTQKLARCVHDLKSNSCFLAEEDVERFKIDLHRLKLRHDCKQLKPFVRFNVARLEKMFYTAGQLVPHLDFDGARSVTSLLCLHWRMLMRMQLEPESIYNPDGVLTRRDQLSLKSRHLLGLEGGIPIIPESDHAGDH